MDWFKSSLATAQKQAQEAAERARVLATQASVQARDYAEKASEKAKDLAKVAAEEAQQRLTQLSTATQSQARGKPAPSPEELEAYGITTELMEFISGMTYSTFSDYPLDSLPPSACIPGSANVEEFKLNVWQQRHAMLLLDTVHQLHDLRFVLCPRRMTEARFWVIYFTMVRRLLPAEAFSDQPQLPELGRSAASPSGSGSGAAAGAAPAVTSVTAAAAGALAAVKSSFSRSNSTPATPAHRSSPSTPAFATSAAASAADPSASAQQATAANLPNRASSGTTELTSEVMVEMPAASVEEDDADGLAELENDAELEAYLQEALKIDKDDGEGSDVDDLDEYLNQLDAELNDDELGDDDALLSEDVDESKEA